MITSAQWLRVLAYCGVKFTTATNWARVFEARAQPENFNLGLRELDDFVGQTLWETGCLEKLVENLNYSAQRMTEVWPGRFPTISSAQPYANNPKALANKTYGGRMGNTLPDSGWRYRGRGIPMVTGYDNYLLVQKLTGLPLVAQPEILEVPDSALRCAVLWWEKKIPDSAIDSVERVTKAVQGGQEALAQRRALTEKASRAIRECATI